ncbi:hypothetical protein EJ02DRAFT_484442 [Clathrospora elynae]|uniref:Uncharacterized protein n=1 Tax=Clathrospora elynae TaxID=706981 RepID=A0A6A5T420_9PLEO|nr:hypothetical protein EJ02DRAFT_484442 [Clathrospora elynae]
MRLLISPSIFLLPAFPSSLTGNSAAVAHALARSPRLASSATTSSLIQRIRPRTIDNGTITSNNASCGDAHIEFISTTLNDSINMANLVYNDPVTAYDNQAYWELFGVNAMNNVTVGSNVFKYINNKWTINEKRVQDAADATCSGRYMYSGIGDDNGDELQDIKAELVFCPEFFQFPPLEYRIRDLANLEATALLRTLFYYIPKAEELDRPISQLWVIMRYQDSIKWTACYGILCATILARLGKGQYQSLYNADNYTLYALAAYVRKEIQDEEFPWLPQISIIWRVGISSSMQKTKVSNYHHKSVTALTLSEGMQIDPS